MRSLQWFDSSLRMAEIMKSSFEATKGYVSSPLRGTNSGASIPEEEGTTGHGNSQGINREEGGELMGLHLNFPLTTPLPFLSKPLPSLGSGSTVCPAGALCLSTMGSSSSTQHHFAFQNAEKGMRLFCFRAALVPKALAV